MKDECRPCSIREVESRDRCGIIWIVENRNLECPCSTCLIKMMCKHQCDGRKQFASCGINRDYDYQPHREVKRNVK